MALQGTEYPTWCVCSATGRSQALPAQTLHFLQGNLMLLGALSLVRHLFTAA